jgi:hypothetical protein
MTADLDHRLVPTSPAAATGATFTNRVQVKAIITSRRTELMRFSAGDLPFLAAAAKAAALLDRIVGPPPLFVQRPIGRKSPQEKET